jgi:hypothetical protein
MSDRSGQCQLYQMVCYRSFVERRLLFVRVDSSRLRSNIYLDLYPRFIFLHMVNLSMISIVVTFPTGHVSIGLLFLKLYDHGSRCNFYQGYLRTLSMTSLMNLVGFSETSQWSITTIFYKR